MNYVYTNLKEDFPKEEIIINGGITSVDEVKSHLNKTNGVMIGRAAYHTPYLLADIEKEIFNNENVPSRQEVIERLIPYVKDELKKGYKVKSNYETHSWACFMAKLVQVIGKDI